MSKQSLPIAVQLYSLRNLKLPFDEILGGVAAIGYSGVELINNHGISSDEMKALLSKHNLVACSAHVPIQAIESDPQAVIDFHSAVDNHVIVIPWIGEDMRGSDAATWQSFGRKLDGIGQRFADAGMKLLYHNHDFEMRVFNDQTGIEWMLDAAKPSNLGWEADVAWIARGGQQIERLLDKYAGRIPRLHAKDNAPVGQNVDQGGFADVGHGTVEWPGVLAAAKRAGVEWYVVEHDLPKDPMHSIKRSYEFLSANL
ncbi:MAG: sugar phosphate isomerase/epimerase [Caldilineaceae bacterium]